MTAHLLCAVYFCRRVVIGCTL